jgi:hypothetical protein
MPTTSVQADRQGAVDDNLFTGAPHTQKPFCIIGYQSTTVGPDHDRRAGGRPRQRGRSGDDNQEGGVTQMSISPRAAYKSRDIVRRFRRPTHIKELNSDHRRPFRAF